MSDKDIPTLDAAVFGGGDAEQPIVDDMVDARRHNLSNGSAGARNPLPHNLSALAAGLLVVVATGGLAGWMGVQAHQAQQSVFEREQFLEAARQGALNLTTIDWQHAEADVQRIVDSATGAFYSDFSQRAQPFVDVVAQAKSKSLGQVVDAGLESLSDNDAQALVAVTVKTSIADAPDSPPRAWRMRISMQKVGQDVKISNVEFVP